MAISEYTWGRAYKAWQAYITKMHKIKRRSHHLETYEELSIEYIYNHSIIKIYSFETLSVSYQYVPAVSDPSYA